jgi:hypothetical protein
LSSRAITVCVISATVRDLLTGHCSPAHIGSD